MPKYSGLVANGFEHPVPVHPEKFDDPAHTMLRISMRDLDSREIDLIGRFRKHPVFAHVEEFTQEVLLKVLVQRRFLSLMFTPMFQLALGYIADLEAAEVVRDIVREEYPQKEPSHGENLVIDLITLGATQTQIVCSTPTPQTIHCVQRSVRLLERPLSKPAMEIRALAVIRFWGETLVSEEYDCLKTPLADMGLCEENSRFYWPHSQHDHRYASFERGASSGTHSDRLTMVLRRLMDSPEKLHVCAEATYEVFRVKSRFYDQFLSSARLDVASS